MPMVSLRLDDDELAAVERVAQAEQRSRSQVIRMLMREALAARGER